MIKNVLVGTDAEVPLVLATGEPFPATGLVPGTKEAPAKLGKLPKGFAVQQDNVNLEFNVPPASDAHIFVRNIQRAMDAVAAMLPKTVICGWGNASSIYREEFMNHPQVLQFGCDPDYNIWTMEENPRPRAENPLLRSAAAHVHVGWDEPTNEDRIALVKMLDLFLGYRFINVEDYRRKELYGKAGSFRGKEYGIEYRTLGNFWIPNYVDTVFYSVQDAVDAVNRGLKIPDELVPKLRRAIDTGQDDEALYEFALRQGCWKV